MAIQIEVAYAAGPENQTLLAVSVSESCTAEKAIHLSGILDCFPEIDLTTTTVGIFGRKIALSQRLADGDRIEIYRPLMINPKEARQLRVQQGNIENCHFERSEKPC